MCHAYDNHSSTKFYLVKTVGHSSESTTTPGVCKGGTREDICKTLQDFRIHADQAVGLKQHAPLQPQHGGSTL